MCEFTEICRSFWNVVNIGQKWQTLYVKLYKYLPCVAVNVSEIGTDVLCEVRAETEKTTDNRNITNREDRL